MNDVAAWSNVPSSLDESLAASHAEVDVVNLPENYSTHNKHYSGGVLPVPSVEETLSLSETKQQFEELYTSNKNLACTTSELMTSALNSDPAKAIEVCFNYTLATRIVLLDTSRQLNCIVFGISRSDSEEDVLDYLVSRPRGSRVRHSHIPSDPIITTEIATSYLSNSNGGPERMMDEDSAELFVSSLSQQLKNSRKIKESMKIELQKKNRILFAFKMAQLYRENDQIAKELCCIANVMATYSIEGCRIIVESDCSDYFCYLYNELWKDRSTEKKKAITQIAGVFFQLSYHKEFCEVIRKKKYIKMLMKTFKVSGFERYDIICASALVNIIQNSENWDFWLSKEELGDVIVKSIRTWELGILEPPIKIHSYKEKLLDVQYKSQPFRELSAWILANMTTIDPKTHCPKLRKENGVEILKEVLNDETCDEEVKKLVRKTLINLKKNNGIVLIIFSSVFEFLRTKTGKVI